MQRLLNLFNKKNDVLFGWKIEFCSSHGRIAGEIAAYKDTLGMTDSVIRVGWNHILRHCAKENAAGNTGCRLLATCYLESHRTMYAHHTCTSNCIKQNGDVAMTYQPFGILLKAFLCDSV